MTNDELLLAATQNTAAAMNELEAVHEIGQVRPVPPELFTKALVHLRAATSAMVALEQRARGVLPPRIG
mgnify:CR=1 FL=1